MPFKAAGDWIIDSWKEVTAFLTAGYFGYRMMAWFFGQGLRLHDLELWRQNADKQLKDGKRNIDATHESVIKIGVKVDEMRAGQKQILDRVNSCQLRDGCPPGS